MDEREKKMNCYSCKNARFEYYMDDIDWDITICKKFWLYDDDARFYKLCGIEGKYYLPKNKLSWLLYDIRRWVKIAGGILMHFIHYHKWWWKPLRNSKKQLSQRISNG